MRLILIGPPGAGKGTQAHWIAGRYRVAHVSTGDMLRSAVASGDALGRRVEQIMQSGQLVDDESIEQVLRARLNKPDCADGFVLDGVPRTLTQAQALERVNGEMGCALDGVLQLKVDDAALVRRLAGRRVHPGSGRVYHVEFNPPRRDGVDDLSGEALEQRPDDSEDTVRARLAVYRRDTEPLLRYYDERGLLSVIAADGTVEEVSAQLGAFIDKMMPVRQ